MIEKLDVIHALNVVYVPMFVRPSDVTENVRRAECVTLKKGVRE